MAEVTYYVEAVGEKATIIGRRFIEPNRAPVEFTEEEYRQSEAEIKHYVDAGVVMVHKSGTKRGVRAAAEIKAEIEQMEQVVAERQAPPGPVQVPLQQQVMPQHVASETIPTFSEPDDPADGLEVTMRCVAITARGNRCKNTAIEGKLVCEAHMRQLTAGKVVRDATGRRISEDGTSLEGEG